MSYSILLIISLVAWVSHHGDGGWLTYIMDGWVVHEDMFGIRLWLVARVMCIYCDLASEPVFYGSTL
jgi:hypothetical protein